MKNFPITYQNKTYWIARNVTTICAVFTSINDEWYILANQRGDNELWNLPCGYVDFDETIEQAAIREVYEETGILLKSINLIDINDNPKEHNQNITFRYYTIVSNPQFLSLDINSEKRGGEKGEVKDVRWISIAQLSEYNWAFNHNELILNLINKLKII